MKNKKWKTEIRWNVQKWLNKWGEICWRARRAEKIFTVCALQSRSSSMWSGSSKKKNYSSLQGVLIRAAPDH